MPTAFSDISEVAPALNRHLSSATGQPNESTAHQVDFSVMKTVAMATTQLGASRPLPFRRKFLAEMLRLPPPPAVQLQPNLPLEVGRSSQLCK